MPGPEWLKCMSKSGPRRVFYQGSRKSGWSVKATVSQKYTYHLCYLSNGSSSIVSASLYCGYRLAVWKGSKPSRMPSRPVYRFEDIALERNGPQKVTKSTLCMHNIILYTKPACFVPVPSYLGNERWPRTPRCTGPPSGAWRAGLQMTTALPEQGFYKNKTERNRFWITPA